MTFIYACATVTVLTVLAAVGVSVWSAVRVCPSRLINKGRKR